MSTDSRPPGRRRRRTGLIRVLVVPGITGLLGLAGLVGLPGLPRLASGEDPAAEVTAAVQRFGASGTLWGRLAVEEESPDGAWTPLGAVEITLYPAVPSLVAELEQIRQSARGSGAEYESAISRLRAVLAAHQIRVATVLHGAPPPPKPPDQPKASDSKRPWWAPMKVGQKADPDKAEADKAEAAKPQTAKATTAQGEAGKPGEGPAKSDSPGQGAKVPPGAEPASGPHPAKPDAKSDATSGATSGAKSGAKSGDGDGKTEAPPGWHRTTDPAGLFVFDDLPSGDWLLVAIRVTPYGPSRGHQEVKKPSPSRAKSFLATPGVAFKEAEVWLTRVRVPPGDRTALLLTDRARWMVGPIR